MSHPTDSPEAPVQQDPSAASLDPEETATKSPILEAAETGNPDTPPKPWWKASGKTLLE
ncbi:MAG: hypothetical protein HC812_04380 [Leptolyngbya sp. RL_3_1]|nr:hypothetical protein [Leptolyngbya sp. RL_3_1]